MLRKTALALAAGLALSFGSADARTIDLGFIMDRSNSIPDTDFNQTMDALSAALAANIPVGGPDTYTISVVTFNGSAANIVERTTINTQDDLDAVVAAVAAPTGTSGVTNYKEAFDLLNANFNNGALLGDDSIINMMTDGNPNEPGTDPQALAAAIDSAKSLQDNGWDSLSFEAVGNNIDSSLLANLGFGPGDAPDDATDLPIFNNVGQVADPLNQPFVLTLDSFDEYNNIIGTKVQKTVNPDPIPPIPLPAGLPLLLAGVGVFGFVARRRKMAA